MVEMRVAEKQVPLTLMDKHYSEPEKSSILYANDFVPEKPGKERYLDRPRLGPTPGK